MIEAIIAVLAFGIASGTLAYNVHEFRQISKDLREGNERIAKIIGEGDERLAKLVSEGLEKLHKDHMAIASALKPRR